MPHFGDKQYGKCRQREIGGSIILTNFADVIHGSPLKEVKEGTESRLDLGVREREREREADREVDRHGHGGSAQQTAIYWKERRGCWSVHPSANPFSHFVAKVHFSVIKPDAQWQKHSAQRSRRLRLPAAGHVAFRLNPGCGWRWPCE